MVCSNRARKGKKGQQQQQKGKESPIESPTSPQKDEFKFDDKKKVHVLCHVLHLICIYIYIYILGWI